MSYANESRVIRRAARRLLAVLLTLATILLAAPAGPRLALGQTGSDLFQPQWSSVESNVATSMAWGDVDGDGDLDLAVGNFGQPNRLYRNTGGTLVLDSGWLPPARQTQSLAWGDVDGDGRLDLVVGNRVQPDQLYRNINGTLVIDSNWTTPSSNTTSVAWGDVDGDGKLDLAVGNYGQPGQLYRNISGTLTPAPGWTTPSSNTTSVAWGDVDGDGKLDLAVGNYGQPGQLYRNISGTLTLAPGWTTPLDDTTRSVAWGDVDGDGKLDLVVGNGGVGSGRRPSRLYHNTGGTLVLDSSWAPLDAPTQSVAWGDYDGDGKLDLAVGNGSSVWADRARVYHNNNGHLDSKPVWETAQTGLSYSVAWGDMDGDGKLDLAVGNGSQFTQVYRNTGGTLARDPGWAPPPAKTSSVAWGDMDGDGKLDLAVGNNGQPNRLYRNTGGTLVPDPSWTPTTTTTTSLAWGDVDGDGKLDLAIGNNGQPNQLYRNTGGTLVLDPSWTPTTTATTSLAWGDVDGDGKLDLAIGNNGQPNQLYRNTGGTLVLDPGWRPPPAATRSVAWGDMDGDGNLDLVVGNENQPNRLYRNTGGTLVLDSSWAPAAGRTKSVAWGDYDGDGDLDLAVATVRGPTQVYRNIAGRLESSVAWQSNDVAVSTSVAWGDVDGDGDLDLAVGNADQSSRVYRNSNGRLENRASWESGDVDGTTSIAWGDVDGDGDLDLAAGNSGSSIQAGRPNRLYRNIRDARLSQAPIPVVHIARPVPPGDADLYSAPTIWSGSTIPLTYTLSHPSSLPVRQVVGMYSLDGGGQWRPAIAASGTLTTNLSTSPGGTVHTYTWDVFKSGVMGLSDDVVFRLVAIPAITSEPNRTPGPYLRGSYAASTFPFRVQGTRVRVLNDGQPAVGALVYRLPDGQFRGAEPLAGGGQPFRTDAQGYLPGRGVLEPGDQIVALLPITHTDTYTLYATSAAPTPTGLQAAPVITPGLQTLTVSPANPLVLFNLQVALEWDARADPQFLAQLEIDLKRASEFLYDWTNGQAALGSITVYQAKQHWNDANIRIYATDRLRPNANQGGIVSSVISDTTKLDISYAPGQLRIGAVWNRYGEASGTLGEDWPRTLAHELGHYALYLDDDYIGLDANGVLVPVTTCTGTAMSDPYRDDYSEFHPAADWLPGCAATLSNQETGRSDWSTITTFYPQLNAPAGTLAGVNPGPSVLPLEVTQVQVVDPDPARPSDVLNVPIFLLSRQEDKSSYLPSNSARAFLFRRTDGASSSVSDTIDLGSPTQDHVLARGARPGDRLCVYDLAAGRLGCQENVIPTDQQLPMTAVDWHPEIAVTPVTSTTVAISVTNVPDGLTLKARIFPVSGAATPEQPLDPAGAGQYAGSFSLPAPTFEGYVQVWVDGDTTPRREAMTGYALGGNPGEKWGRDAPRGDPGEKWGRDAPVISSDGQAILFGKDLAFAEGQFFALQATTSIPTPPSWATVVGSAYRITANLPVPKNMSISFSYLGRDVPPGEEGGLRIYFWDAAYQRWEMLPTVVNPTQNNASAQADQAGLYALMSSVEVPISGPGWNLIAYPIQGTRPITEALASIDGFYTTVYGYDRTDAGDPWKVYDVDAPAWVNDLHELEYGHGYWINATTAITLYLKGGSSATLATASVTAGSVPIPPATYYGAVLPGSGFTPAAGMPVRAFIDDILCGLGQTLAVDGQIVYTVNVTAAGAESDAGCGAPGRMVMFEVGGQRMATTAPWDNSRVWALALNDGIRVLLPLLQY